MSVEVWRSRSEEERLARFGAFALKKNKMLDLVRMLSGIMAGLVWNAFSVVFGTHSSETFDLHAEFKRRRI
jgi:hypothetical protein